MLAAASRAVLSLSELDFDLDFFDLRFISGGVAKVAETTTPACAAPARVRRFGPALDLVAGAGSIAEARRGAIAMEICIIERGAAATGDTVEIGETGEGGKWMGFW